MEQTNGNPSRITLGHIKEGDLVHLEVKAQNTPETWHKIGQVMSLLSGQPSEEKPLSKSDKLWARVMIGVGAFVGLGVIINGVLVWRAHS